jgi:hypothetical protein
MHGLSCLTIQVLFFPYEGSIYSFFPLHPSQEGGGGDKAGRIKKLKNLSPELTFDCSQISTYKVGGAAIYWTLPYPTEEIK